MVKIASIRHGGVTIVGLVHEHPEELLEPKPQADYSNALDLRKIDPKLLERGVMAPPPRKRSLGHYLKEVARYWCTKAGSHV